MSQVKVFIASKKFVHGSDGAETEINPGDEWALPPGWTIDQNFMNLNPMMKGVAFNEPYKMRVQETENGKTRMVDSTFTRRHVYPVSEKKD